MGKKRAVAAMTTTIPLFPFPAAADETGPPYHFSDYGFDPQLLCSSQLPETKRAAARRHQQQPPPPPVEPARFKLHKPISKKHQRTQSQTQHSDKQRRRWWSSAASSALLFFKRPSSNSSHAARTASSTSCSSAAAVAPPVPLYFADDGGDDSTGCTCWSPAVRSGHMTAAELGVASVSVPYVSLRDVNFGGGVRGAGGVAPSMPIYLVT